MDKLFAKKLSYYEIISIIDLFLRTRVDGTTKAAPSKKIRIAALSYDSVFLAQVTRNFRKYFDDIKLKAK